MSFVLKAVSVVLVTFFIGGMFLCVGMSTSMKHSMPSGEMPCPMTDGSGGCHTPTDHISYWNHILSIIPVDFVALVVALAAACACVWLFSRNIWNPLRLLSTLVSSTSPPRLFLPRHSLQETFSNGILHPKLY